MPSPDLTDHEIAELARELRLQQARELLKAFAADHPDKYVWDGEALRSVTDDPEGSQPTK